MIQGLFERLLQGHRDAVALCTAVFEWANDYDHCVDGDAHTGARAPEAVLHDAMWTLAVTLPQNAFFRAHQAELTVTMANAISTWRASTVLQQVPGEHASTLAHVMRWVPIEFFMHCARIVGGRAWADEQGPAFWLLMTQDHSRAEFVAETKGES